MFKPLLGNSEAHELPAAIVTAAGRWDMKALADATGFKKYAMDADAAAPRATGYLLDSVAPLRQTKHRHVGAVRRGLGVDWASANLLRATAGRCVQIGEPR
ncbi:hypothetical protein LL972_10160 [Xanthomonas campestris pv. asclepiadis]|uniref:hypothetical protein n=1 Tax=Xanthomonas campestris TaxID=339 RepID=UPI001E2EC2FC|nr:hypothetical protein [Xanthomonas campestris]MCC4616363.1 hypothetical protein [Xanthomonas campestris pv. asclepiadis]